MLAHEISHVGNRDILIGSVAAAVAMGITFVARMAMWASIFGGGGDRDRNVFAVLALIILAPVAAMLLQMALSRSREFEADRTGAGLIGDGEPLARPLAEAGRLRPADPRWTSGPAGAGVHRQPADGPQGELRQPLPHATRPPRSGSPASASRVGAR